MDVHVRPFHPHDYPRVAKIRSEAGRDDITAEDLRRYDEQWDHSRFEKVRVVAHDEERVTIGYGELHHEPNRFDPRAYFLHLAVDRTYRRRGVATAIWEHVEMELHERSATVVRLRTLDPSPGAEWARGKGFARTELEPRTGRASFERLFRR